MNCPNCKAKMEVEHSPIVRGSTFEEYRRTGRETHQTPSANYYCVECDSEWVWIRGVRGVRMIDGAKFDQLRHAV